MLHSLKTSGSRALLSPLLALSLVAGACATGGGGGLPDDPVLKDFEPKRWVGTPKSGLRVIVQEDHSSPLVSIVATYGVGSTADPQGVEGLAHFVEHLVFRSKPYEGDLQYWDHLKRVGGDFNATTSWDFTNYFTTAHKSNLKILLQLEAWRLTHTLDGVTPGVFAAEREVVRNELRLGWETTGNNKLLSTLFDQMYPEGHPMRRPVVGSHDSLTAAKLEHAQAFVKEHYRPDNCTIVIVGDVDTEEVKKLIGTWPVEALFGPGGPEGPAIAPRPRVAERQARPVPPPVSTALKRHRSPVENPQLFLGWSLPPGLRGQDSVAAFAASRLNLAVQTLDYREEDDIIGAGAFDIAFADSSVIVLQANLRPGADPDKAHKRLLDVLVRAWSTPEPEGPAEGSSEDILKRLTEESRWASATSLLMEASDPLSTAEQLSRYMAATGKTSYFKENFEELAAISASQVTDFAYKWLTRERAVAVYLEPDTDRIPTTEKASSGSGASPAGASTAGQGGSHQVARGLATDASALTSERLLKVVRSPGLASTPRFVTSNGLEVFVRSRPEMPLAQIALSLGGGEATSRPVGSARLARQMSRPKCEQFKSLDDVGGQMGGGMGLTSDTISVDVMAGNLSNGLAALRDRVSCVEVSEETFLHLPRLLKQQGKVFEQSSKRPEFVAGKWFNSQLYPDHPYGEAGYVNPNDLAGMRRDDAQAFVSSHFRPGNGILVVTGGVSADEVKSASERYLSTWPAGGGGASMAPPSVPAGPTERRLQLVHRPGATQASVTIGCRLENMKPERLPAYDVLQTLARESAWTLREQWGATYGIGAGVVKHDDGTAHFTLNGAIEKTQAGKGVAQLLEMIQAIGTAKVAEPLFLTTRWDVGRTFMASLARVESQAAAIASARRRGWNLDVWDKYPENLASTTRDTLRELMGPCLGKEVIAIVGDSAVLKPQLEAAGLKVQ